MDIKHLETQYLKAKVAYYDGNPIMTDAAFDVLEQELKNAGSKVIEQVGAKRKDFDFPHPTSMKSLSKLQTSSTKGVTDYQELPFMDWLRKRISLLKNAHGKTIDHIFYSPKFDGSAINIVYRNRKLESVLTRGDGQTGKDVTDRFRKHLYSQIFETEHTGKDDSIIQIRCEAVMRKSVFEATYADKFANARNLVAGIIGRDDIDEAMVSDITLIPIHYIIDGVHQDVKYTKGIFSGCPIIGHHHSVMIRPIEEDYLSSVKYMEKERDNFEYPLDGIVFSLPTDVRELLGENDHDPEWAIAIKFVPDEVVTPVEKVEWNLGKTGELTPVVILKPVQLAGTTVKRASGYNAGYILNNKIGDGTIVSIAKAGDIIPEIQAVHTPGKVANFPSNCPACGSLLVFDKIHLYCDNDECVGKTAKKLAAACGMLDLKGIAGKTIEPFAEDYNSMFELFVAVLNGTYRKEFDIEKYGIKYDSRSHQIFQAAFMNIKSLTFAQVILMMGYDGVGRKLSEQVAKEYCGLEPDYKGHEKVLVEMFKDEDIKSYILDAVYALESLGVHVDKPEDKKDSGNTIYVCMTGSPKSFGFKTKEEFVAQFPNVEEVAVTDAKCNYLITDDLNSSSGKMKAAEKKGVKIVTYATFKA